MAKDNWFKGIILGILITVGGWAVFQLVLSLLQIPFDNAGIVDPVYQYLVIIGFVIVALIFGWNTGLKDAVKKLVR